MNNNNLFHTASFSIPLLVRFLKVISLYKKYMLQNIFSLTLFFLVTYISVK